MSLTYAERQPLVAALRRYVYDASADEYCDSAKMRLLDVIDKFERMGYGIVEGTDSQRVFDELMQKASPENASASPKPRDAVFNAFYL